jgi:hypothetical protein
MKDDKLYLIHISECVEKIESYTNQIDIDKEGFLDSMYDVLLLRPKYYIQPGRIESSVTSLPNELGTR